MPEAASKQPKAPYAMLRHTKDASKLHELLSEHLAWMRDNEKAGRVFLSCPTEPSAGSALNGLTIIEAASLEDTEALAQQDPLIRSGTVAHSMQRWTVNEGRIALTLTLSDHSTSLG